MSSGGRRAWPLFSLLALLVLAGLAAMARRRYDVVAVRGRSMAPTLGPGDRLLVARLSRPARVGEIVLARDPRLPRRELIKRVSRIGPGGVTLRGDDPYASTDGRVFGALPASAVRWRVVLRYWPPRRIGAGPYALEALEEGGEAACAVPEALVASD